MKVQELRIGNLANYKYFNPDPKNSKWEFEIVEILGILKDDFYFKFRNNSKTKKTKELHPIPLTEEWLINFGFKAESYYNNFIFNAVEISSTVRVISTNERKSFNLVGKYEIRIDYVHQLQNLYHALTGQELTIKTK